MYLVKIDVNSRLIVNGETYSVKTCGVNSRGGFDAELENIFDVNDKIEFKTLLNQAVSTSDSIDQLLRLKEQGNN